MESTSAARAQPGRRDALVARISHVLAAIAGSALLALFLVNVAQIAARPLMGGWIWVNDLSRLLVAWVIMIGASAAIGLREHLVVDFVVQRAPVVFRRVCAYVVRIAEIGIGFILFVSGLSVAMSRMSIHYIQLGLPTGYAFLAVPVLGLFMMVFGLLASMRTGEQPAGTHEESAAEGGDQQ